MKKLPHSPKKHKALRRSRRSWTSLGRINVRSKNKFNPKEEDIKHGLISK